jgi:hypothetical protein
VEKILPTQEEIESLSEIESAEIVACVFEIMTNSLPESGEFLGFFKSKDKVIGLLTLINLEIQATLAGRPTS